METTKQKSLKDFIEENNSLLSTLAIFAGLLAATPNLKIGWLSGSLAFLFIGAIIVVFSEINSYLPKEYERSLRLDLFHYVLFLGMWGMIAYWLLVYRDFWNIFLWVPLTIIFALSFQSTLKEIIQIVQYFAKIPKIKALLESKYGKATKNYINKILKPFIKARFGIIFLLSLVAAIIYSIPINLICTGIAKIFH